MNAFKAAGELYLLLLLCCTVTAQTQTDDQCVCSGTGDCDIPIAQLLEVKEGVPISFSVYNISTVPSMRRWCLNAVPYTSDYLNLTITYTNPLTNDAENGKTLYLVEGFDCNKIHKAIEIHSEGINGSRGRWILLHVTEDRDSSQCPNTTTTYSLVPTPTVPPSSATSAGSTSSATECPCTTSVAPQCPNASLTSTPTIQPSPTSESSISTSVEYTPPATTTPKDIVTGGQFQEIPTISTLGVLLVVETGLLIIIITIFTIREKTRQSHRVVTKESDLIEMNLEAPRHDRRGFTESQEPIVAAQNGTS